MYVMLGLDWQELAATHAPAPVSAERMTAGVTTKFRRADKTEAVGYDGCVRTQEGLEVHSLLDWHKCPELNVRNFKVPAPWFTEHCLRLGVLNLAFGGEPYLAARLRRTPDKSHRALIQAHSSKHVYKPSYISEVASPDVIRHSGSPWRDCDCPSCEVVATIQGGS